MQEDKIYVGVGSDMGIDILIRNAGELE